MMLIIYMFCLFFTAFVLQQYVVRELHPYDRRLLQLIVGLTSVYPLCEIVVCLEGESAAIRGIEALLFMQILYLLIFYLIDFNHIKAPGRFFAALFLLFVFFNILIIFQLKNPRLCRNIGTIWGCGCVVVLFGIVTYVYWKNYAAKREKWVVSEAGKGTMFAVSLPQQVEPMFWYQKAEVLLADDMEINREIFAELARPWGFHIDYARNGEEAVEAAKRKKYDLIFLDLWMPVMDGVEAAGKIREFSDVPLVALTADITEKTAEICRRNGMTDYLNKPIQMIKLKNIIEKYLPEYLRQQIPLSRREDLSSSAEQEKCSVRTLRTFLRELSRLREQMKEDADRDLDLFRIRVHGIKGAGRQFEKAELAEFAEIMEMAAASNHRNFLEEHLEQFRALLMETEKEVRAELQMYEDCARELSSLKKEGAAELPAEETREDCELCWKKLREGFADYEIKVIEEQLEILGRQELPEEKRELLARLQECCEEFEYEKGAELLRERIQFL